MSKTFALSGLSLGNDSSSGSIELDLLARVTRMLNVSVVQGAGVGEMMFAGSYRKGLMEERVLITLISDSEQLTVRLNCEDAVLSPALMKKFKKSLSS